VDQLDQLDRAERAAQGRQHAERLSTVAASPEEIVTASRWTP
jgi:hypothetical protein